MVASEWRDSGALSSGLVLGEILEPLFNIAQVSGLSVTGLLRRGTVKAPLGLQSLELLMHRQSCCLYPEMGNQE